MKWRLVRGFFDSVSGDRSYNSDAWAQWSKGILSEGYVPDVGDELVVTESSPTAMSVQVGLGVAWVDGRYFEVYSAAEELTIPASDGSNPRIDRIVVRNDLNARETVLAVLEGTPATTPSAPALTRDSTTYEISLAQIAVGTGVTSITNSDITDERDDKTVCGVAGPHASDELWTLIGTFSDSDSATIFAWDSGTISPTFDFYHIIGWAREKEGLNSSIVGAQVNAITTSDYTTRHLSASAVGETLAEGWLVADVKGLDHDAFFDLLLTTTPGRVMITGSVTSTSAQVLYAGWLDGASTITSIRISITAAVFSGDRNGIGEIRLYGANL